MKGKLSSLGLVLVLSALIFGGCGPGPAEPTEAPTPTPTEVAVEVPDDVRASRDSALAYVVDHYGEQAPAPGLTWAEEFTTPEGLVGWVTYEFRAEDWVVTIGTAVVPPEMRRYEVMVNNPATGFRWEGRVDAERHVTEGPEMVLTALDEALAYTIEHYPDDSPAPDLTWEGGRTTPEGLIGSETFQYAAEDWVVTISYPVVAPEEVVYSIVVANPTTWFWWEGELDAERYLTETAAPTAGQPTLCWYGRVDSTPEDHAIDRLLVLLPEEAFSVVGVIGADDAIEAQIEALRDSGIYAHFWGVLNCDLGCQLVVTRLRPEGPEGPFFDPDPVEGWEGTVVGNPPDAQFDDYFVLAGSIAVRYGIDSADATIAAQLENLRDTGSIIRVWGQVTCPAIDFHGTQIQVTRLEVAIEAPAAGEGYEGWNAYTSAKFGYTLRYPGECTVMGSNLNQQVQFADVNKHWPVLGVRHYDSDFYHPPAGTDVRQWIAHYTYDEIDAEAEIAGLPAVHLIYEEGPGWEASDEYYFIRGDQLFSILILHSGGQQDWDLYNKFLKSFTFVTEIAVEGQPVVCWYGRVVGLPEGAQFDDYLALEPEGAGEIVVEGANAEIEAEIEGLRDKEEPWNYAHFWGTLTCDVLDYGGCQLLATRLRPEGPEGPFFEPDPVEAWEGTIVSNPPDAQFDDYFVLAGDFPVGFGIDSSDPEVAGQLERLRDTQTTIRIWGEVTCPAIDSFGTHIVVTRIEIQP